MQEHQRQGQQCDKLVTCCGFGRGLAVQKKLGDFYFQSVFFLVKNYCQFCMLSISESK
jgi:hypothetical protein